MGSNGCKVSLAFKAYKWRQKLPLFIGNVLGFKYIWNKFEFVWINLENFRSWSCEILVTNPWFWSFASHFMLSSDAFGHGKWVCPHEKWSQVDLGMIQHYRSRWKTKFRSPCSCLGQIQSNCEYCIFLWAKWSLHGVEQDAKRIKSKGAL